VQRGQVLFQSSLKSSQISHNSAISVTDCQAETACGMTNLSSYNRVRAAFTCMVGYCMRYVRVLALKETRSPLVLASKLGEL